MDLEYIDFIKALSTAASNLSVNEIAEKYGCKSQFIYQIINGTKTAGWKTQVKIAKACGYKTVTDFINRNTIAEDGPSASNCGRQPISFKNTVEKKHFEEIKKFKNREAGLEVNKFLVRLESLNVKEFHKIIDVYN